MKRILFLLAALLTLPTGLSGAVRPKLPAEPKPLSGPRVDVRDFGAAGDGVTDDTQALQAAIDACRKGTVVLTPGIYRAKTLFLHSNMELHLEAGAVLKATDKQEDFPPLSFETTNHNWTKARVFLFALRAHDLRITGPGVIDGNGYAPDWEGQREGGRPVPIAPAKCRRVLLENFTLKDGAMWNIVPFETDDCTIRNVRIDANIFENRDGIDIVDCHRVLIENCAFYTDDDCICPKSGHKRGVRDVTVRHCRVEKCNRANGIKFGTMSYGGFQNMLFHDIELNDIRLSGIAVESVDGAKIRNLEFRDITMDGCGNALFVIRGLRGIGGQKKAGCVKGIRFERIKAVNARSTWGCVVAGTGDDHVQDIVLKDVDITFAGGLDAVPPTPEEYDGRYPECNMWGHTPAAGLYFRHADGVRLENCRLQLTKPDARELIVTEDADVDIR